MTGLSYMQRRKGSGIYEFRKALPRSLAGLPVPAHLRGACPELINPATGHFKREVTKSLGTADYRTASARNAREGSRVQDLFEMAERMLRAGPPVPTEADRAEMAEAVVADWLAFVQEQRFGGDDRRNFQTEEDRRRWPDLVPLTKGPGDFGMEKDHHAVHGEFIEEELAAARLARSEVDVAAVKVELASHLRSLGLTMPENREEVKALLSAAFDARISALEKMAERQAGRETVVWTALPSQRGPKLSEALAEWKAGGGGRDGRKVTALSAEEAGRAVRRFTERYGDLQVGSITRAKAREFRDALVRLPKGLPKKIADLPLMEILKRADLGKYPLRSVSTVNKEITLIGAVVAAAEKAGHLDAIPDFRNPFVDLQLTQAENAAEGREELSRDDLTALFARPVYAVNDRPRGGGGEAAFWFPLIGLFSGMRLAEIAGLRVGDLKTDPETGRAVFQVVSHEGRRLKTASFRRIVPVHPELERIGLLTYHQSRLTDGPEAPLWPHVQFDPERQGAAAWSKWFGRQRNEAGLPRGKDFHSLRHTFKSMARGAGLDEEVHDALTGHAGGGVGRSYGSVPLTRLVAEMDKVRAPVDLSGLTWRPGRPVVLRKAPARVVKKT
ncbi:site-specific integrase [Chthonobacter albigriseus]|uniref:site-specific integrase n=1 Tax=Chthonobacter albigriseus TaxID=1683161 RepID=UPI0015EF97AC|nr:site-specific integrase [Chthonobacter albigriseus]